MKYNILYPTPLDEINPTCDNVDVCISFESGEQYTLVVCTPDEMKNMMKKSGKPFVHPSSPFLFVKELTKENITKLVEALLREDEIFLKIYGGDLF